MTARMTTIAFECPKGDSEWWYDIVDGLPDPLIVDGAIEVWDRPGMGVELNAEKAKRYLREEDGGSLFDRARTTCKEKLRSREKSTSCCS